MYKVGDKVVAIGDIFYEDKILLYKKDSENEIINIRKIMNVGTAFVATSPTDIEGLPFTIFLINKYFYTKSEVRKNKLKRIANV